MPSYETVLADASRLTEPERGRLVDALWETLPEAALPPLTDEWRAEIARRSAELDAGTATTIPWEQIRDEALARVSGTAKNVGH